MEELILSGRIVDWILVYIVLEALVVCLGQRRWMRGLSVWVYISLLLPGLFIFLALREALTHERWPLIALWLLASFAAHLFDMRQRWRRG